MKKIMLILATATLHGVITFVLYRERALHHREIDDTVLMLIPSVLAGTGYFLALGAKPTVGRKISAMLIAIIGALLSLTTGLFFGVNAYGS